LTGDTTSCLASCTDNASCSGASYNANNVCQTVTNVCTPDCLTTDCTATFMMPTGTLCATATTNSEDSSIAEGMCYAPQCSTASECSDPLVAVCESDSVCTVKSCTGSGQVDATQCPTDGQFCESGVCTVCADTGSTQCAAANQNCNATSGACANIVCDTSVTTYTHSACFASTSVCVADGATGTAGNCQLCSSANGIACGTGYSCDDVMNGTSTGACIVD
jgi:hypothetical protein